MGGWRRGGGDAPSIAATHGFFFCRAAMRSMPFCPMPATSSAAALLSSASSILMLAPAIHEPGLAEISTAPLIASSSSTRVITCACTARGAGARVPACHAREHSHAACVRVHTSSNSWMSSMESVFWTSPGQSSRSTATPCLLTSTLSAVDFDRPRRVLSVPTRLSMVMSARGSDSDQATKLTFALNAPRLPPQLRGELVTCSPPCKLLYMPLRAKLRPNVKHVRDGSR